MTSPASQVQNGIPKAPFVGDDIAAFVKEHGPTVDGTLNRLNDQFMRYKVVERSLVAKRHALKQKVPDIEASLEVCKLIQAKHAAGESMTTQFELTDTLFTLAEVPPTDKVNLWLGANVMLEYPVEEALTLLATNLEQAKKNLIKCQTDLEFVHEQITTMEVNTARVYNWDVRERRKTAPAKA